MVNFMYLSMTRSERINERKDNAWKKYVKYFKKFCLDLADICEDENKV